MTERYDKLAEWVHRLKVLRNELLSLEISDAPIVDRRYWRAYLGEVDRALETAVHCLEELEETR